MKIKFCLIFSFFVLLFATNADAQLAGNGVYQFLNMPVSARVGALGGTMVPVKDGDLNLAVINPAALNKDMSNQLIFNHVVYFSDVSYGYVGYAKSTDSLGTFSAGMQYMNYGTFKQADASGNVTGEFTAGEYALNLGWGKQLDSLFSFGANVKGIYSNFQTVTSTGVAADLALMYANPKNNFSAVLLAKNIGRQLTTYTENNREPLPFEVQFGIAKRLKRAPFRFSILLQHLEKMDLTYTKPADPNANTNFFGDNTASTDAGNSSTLDKAMRHVVLGAEVLLGKSFNIRVGYNYKRRQELLIEDKTGGVGFSWGFGLKINRFMISYGRATYHLAGASNLFSISSNLGEFAKKKRPIDATQQ